MIIAWTALFHSIFFRKKIKPFFKSKGRFVKLEGDFKYWDLTECLKRYFKNDVMNAVKVNLEFFIPLRNKIEHKSIPEIDSDIFGECQAMLLNLDELIDKEFGSSYCIKESLSFALQMFPSGESLSKAIKKNPVAENVVDFINRYRSSLSADVFLTSKYAFKAFLIQVANHKADGVLPIQFVNYDKLSKEQREEIEKAVAMVKFKEINVSNLDKFKSSEVQKTVQAALGNLKISRGKSQVDKFNPDTHMRCWKKYKVRPPGGSKTPQDTDTKYCVYDKPHKDYLYTQEWIDFLVAKMNDSKEYQSLYKTVNVLK